LVSDPSKDLGASLNLIPISKSRSKKERKKRERERDREGRVEGRRHATRHENTPYCKPAQPTPTCP
jgi:hypothetical protein